MKAIQVHEFGSPEVMKVQGVDLRPLKPDEILVEIKAAGVNPVDTYIRAGWYGERKFPFTPGLDASGVVLQVGQDVREVITGQRVFISGSVKGTYAQQTICKSSHIHPLADNVSFEQGAALGVPYGTAWRGLFQRGHAAEGKTVLIHGASGGVGLAAVQLAKAAGLTVIGTAGSEAGRELLNEQGTDVVLDHYDPLHFEQVTEATDGSGVDIVLEMLANVNLANDLKITARHGTVVVIGSRGTIEIDPRDMMSRELSVVGIMGAMASQDEKEAMWSGLDCRLKDGTICPVIATTLPLEDAPKAHVEVIESSHHGKIVLIP